MSLERVQIYFFDYLQSTKLALKYAISLGIYIPSLQMPREDVFMAIYEM